MPERNTATNATRILTKLAHRRLRRRNYADLPLKGGKRVGIMDRGGILSLYHLCGQGSVAHDTNLSRPEGNVGGVLAREKGESIASDRSCINYSEYSLLKGKSHGINA